MVVIRKGFSKEKPFLFRNLIFLMMEFSIVFRVAHYLHSRKVNNLDEAHV